MYCPKCQDAMILTKATAFGEEYHYCRTCKKELKELQVNIPPNGLVPADGRKINVRMVGGGGGGSGLQPDYLMELTKFQKDFLSYTGNFAVKASVSQHVLAELCYTITQSASLQPNLKIGGMIVEAQPFPDHKCVISDGYSILRHYTFSALTGSFGVGGNGGVLTSQGIYKAPVLANHPPTPPPPQAISWALHSTAHPNCGPTPYQSSAPSMTHIIPVILTPGAICQCGSYEWDSNIQDIIPRNNNMLTSPTPKPQQGATARSLIDEMDKEIAYFQSNRGIKPTGVEVAVDFWERLCDEIERRFGKTGKPRPWPDFYWGVCHCRPGTWQAFSPTDWLILS